MSVTLEDEEPALDLFQEPQDYYKPEKPSTHIQYNLQNGQELTLRLVGSSPLWGHLLWNAGRVTARYLEDNVSIINDRTVLELGAGAGLPSIVSAILGASHVVVSDYPEPDLIDNLRINVAKCIPKPLNENISVEGYLWGNETSTLFSHLGSSHDGFDVLILADILFNHSEHEKLVKTVLCTMRRVPESRALVFFTPYRPWLLQKDLKFFEIAESQGLKVHKLFEHQMEEVMFENDPGDALMRRTVFAYEVTWKSCDKGATGGNTKFDI